MTYTDPRIAAAAIVCAILIVAVLLVGAAFYIADMRRAAREEAADRATCAGWNQRAYLSPRPARHVATYPPAWPARPRRDGTARERMAWIRAAFEPTERLPLITPRIPRPRSHDT